MPDQDYRRRVHQNQRVGRKLPLGWNRTILAGMVALVLIFGGVLSYLVYRDWSGNLASRALPASLTGIRIAVLPFEVSGDGADSTWSDRVMDLFATSLDTMTDARVITSRAGPPQADAKRTRTDARATEAGRAVGAQYVLAGRVITGPDGVRITADLHEVSTGKRVIRTTLERSTADDLGALVDALAAQISRSMIERAQRE